MKNTVTVTAAVLIEILDDEYGTYAVTKPGSLARIDQLFQFGFWKKDLKKIKVEKATNLKELLFEFNNKDGLYQQINAGQIDDPDHVYDWGLLKVIHDTVASVSEACKVESLNNKCGNGRFGNISDTICSLSEKLYEKICEFSLLQILYTDGKSYLNSEQLDRFQRALEYAQSPGIFNDIDKTDKLTIQDKQLAQKYSDGLRIISHSQINQNNDMNQLHSFFKDLFKKTSDSPQLQNLLSAYEHLRKRLPLKYLEIDEQKNEYRKLVNNSLLNIQFSSEPESIFAFIVVKYMAFDIYRELQERNLPKVKQWFDKGVKLMTKSGLKSHNSRQLSFNKLFLLASGFAEIREICNGLKPEAENYKELKSSVVDKQIKLLINENRLLCTKFGEEMVSISSGLCMKLIETGISHFLTFTPRDGLTQALLSFAQEFNEKKQVKGLEDGSLFLKLLEFSNSNINDNSNEASAAASSSASAAACSSSSSMTASA